MAISLENIRFLHEQIREQSEKMRYGWANYIIKIIVIYINWLIRFEQLQREELVQRERADAAEKYKVQLENFIDMICHEIRNPFVAILSLF